MHLGSGCVIPPKPGWSGPCFLHLIMMSPDVHSLRTASRICAFLLLLLTAACGGSQKAAEWPPVAKKWFDRATHSYENGDIEDARLASENALSALPDEPKVRLVAAEIAMAELEFDRALQLLRDMPGSEAAGLRGRCHWYLGNIEQAADELATLSGDPEVKDTWAEETLRLARSGRGRRPFEMTGGIVAAVDMPWAGSAMLVPVEVNGEPSLAMVATDRAESVIDSRAASDGGWVSLRFAGRVEVSDVPVVAHDLSGLSRDMGAPIKLLIGVNLLRHLRATIDVAGRQFVVRNYEPPAPPEATTVHPIFYLGGAMVLPGAFGMERTAPSSTLLMNTSMSFPLALDEGGWEKAGLDASKFAAVPGASDLRHGTLPMLRLGAFEIPNVPGVVGAPVEAVEKEVGVNLDGFAGSGLFATFRLTFADSGRILWMEDLPPDVVAMRRRLAEKANESQQRAVQGPAVPDVGLTPPEGLPQSDPSPASKDPPPKTKPKTP